MHRKVAKCAKYVGLLLFLFIASALAETCDIDSGCDDGYFCDESNQTASGQSQCSLISTTTCNSTNISCTSNSDCSGVGTGVCITSDAICDINAQFGEPCQLDSDCNSGYCSLGVCSDDFPKSCSSYTDCVIETQTCVSGVCRGLGDLGAYCEDDGDCFSDICDDLNNVCVECEYSWGWDGSGREGGFPDGKFCNLNHYDTCTLSNPYESYALENNLPVPTIEEKKNDGDTCDDDACCLSDRCEGGRCVGGGSEGYTSTPEHITYCEQLGYSLATYYIDGQPYGSPTSPYYEQIEANWTNINILLNRTDLRPIRYKYPRANRVFVYRFSGNVDHNPRHVFVGYFYSNLTGDLCYVHQKDDEVYAECFESCMSAGLADVINTTPGQYKYGSVSLTDYETVTCTSNDTDMVIQTMPAGGGDGDDWQIFAFTDFDSTGLTVDSIIITGGGSYGGYRYYKDGEWRTVAVFDPTDYSAGGYRSIAVYPFSKCTPADNDCLVGPTTGITQIKGYQYITLPPKTWETTPITFPISSANYENMFCCTNNLDCVSEYGEGWCCNTAQYVCYPCEAGTGNIELKIDSVPSTVAINKQICNGTPATFFVTLLDNDIIVKPSGTITVSIIGGGTINGRTTDSCDADDTPCEFQYTSRDTPGIDNIKFSYSGNDEYAEISTQLNIQVSENCHWLTFVVYDHDDYSAVPRIYTPLYGTAITSDTGVTKTTIPQFFMIRAVAMARFDGLPDSDISFTFTKEGYQTASYNVSSSELNKAWIVTLKRGEEEYRESWGLEDTTPNGTYDAVRGMKSIALGMLGDIFIWIILLVLFFLFLAIIIGLVKSVT